MAEVIKTFAIRNEEMFGVLEESYDKVFDPAANQGNYFIYSFIIYDKFILPYLFICCLKML